MKRKLDCILLVDDNKATNFLNKRLLSGMDVANKIGVTRNGIEALDYLKKSVKGETGYPWPDLILLDINMPIVDGWEFLDKYRQLPESNRNSTIILMLTTSLRSEDESRAQQSPYIKGFIQKPLSKQHLERLISEHFARKDAEDS